MADNPIDIFSLRKKEFSTKADKLNKKYRQVAVTRIVGFLIALVAIFYLANLRIGWAVLLLAIIFPVIFAALIRWHNKIKVKRGIANLLVDINEEEVKRLNFQFKEFPTGLEYLKPLHPYLLDLDIFGKHSIFQLLNRTATKSGEDLLAYMLSKPAPETEIVKRQEAAKELAIHIDWRQELEANGRYFKDPENNIESLLEWLKTPNVVREKMTFKVALYTLPLITVLLIFGFMFFDLSFYYVLGSMVVNSIVTSRVFGVAKETNEATSKSIKALKAYEGMIRQVEKSTFKAKKLVAIQKVFLSERYKASERIKSLASILDGLDSRNNQLYFLLNAIFLLDIYWMMRAESWKENMKENIGHWFDAISELDACNSIAGFSFANPGYTFPMVTEGQHFIEAKALGHPLISSPNKVKNDFFMQGKGKIILITGSNMAGKSTFLRTVGVNVVLGLMGAPVCAESMTLSRMQVFTSMRTTDSLEESVSSFYAELQRLRQLLKLVHSERVMNELPEDLPNIVRDKVETPDVEPNLPVLFMLDEILKGTNSQDRHKGAAALIQQLSKLGASGFVSTHDLELGQMAEHQGIENYSFNSAVEGDSIKFFYKLDKGICRSFNASKLMSKMGIAIDE